MNFKYRWKNHQTPNRESALRQPELLDQSQFSTQQDKQIAEETARKHLNLPAPVPGDGVSDQPEDSSSQGNQANIDEML